MSLVQQIAERATRVDGASPLDEAAAMAIAAGTADVVNRDGVVAVMLGDELVLFTDPPVRGHGLASDLVRSLLVARPEIGRAWSHCNHPAAAGLAASLGWERVRDLWVMRRRVSDETPLPPLVVPAGVELRPFGLRSGDTQELLRVNAAAFAAHPEQGAMDLLNLSARMGEPWFDPAGLILAAPSGQDHGAPSQLFGFHWTKQHSPTLGEVYVVGVDPSTQGRGIGKLVTLAGLHHLADAGAEEILLYVEADNAAAIATYTGLGFTHDPVDTHVMYARP